ncbi:threonine ammonia-lyase [Nocardioides speluncae]|uniref:threonine ammonia-lyase n=1 Tax=Nocardioides speluncae TaxID=2670337 RepID=UPI000D698003|nr:pyridoxal-phosphate dependent enzyme [Nocardioides speluncae]
MTRSVRRPTVADLDAAWEVIRRHLSPSPLWPAEGASPALKLESAQPTGAFKVRGALAALAALETSVPVVTASAGSHALGIAFAARALGHRTTVVTAVNASAAKVAKIGEYDVELVQVGTSYDEAEAHALDLARQGAHYLSAYNDPHVIAGQGTIGKELETQVSGPLTVVCPVGGGGLAAGLGLWASTRDDVRVVGVEAENNPVIRAAVAAGEVVDVELLPTIADGMSGSVEPGSVTVPVIAETVAELVTVTESELRSAMRYLVTERGLVAEGAGAASVAAVLAGKVQAHGTVVAVVSGRNIALPLLVEVLDGRTGH